MAALADEPQRCRAARTPSTRRRRRRAARLRRRTEGRPVRRQDDRRPLPRRAASSAKAAWASSTAARHKVIDKRVAIKVLRGDMAARHGDHRALPAGGAGRVERSATRTSSTSPTSAQLPDGATYFVMEYLDGAEPRRRSWTTQRPHPGRRASCTSRSRSRRGSARRTRAGIVHRDLKPDNVILIDARRRQGLREDPRLRHRQGADGEAAQPHARGQRLRNAALHVARAGGGRAGRSAHGHLLARRHPLRDGRRARSRSTPTTSWGS